MRISRSPSLFIAQIVVDTLTSFIESDENLKDCDLYIGTSVVGRSHALVVVDDIAGKVAWVYRPTNSDLTVVLTGVRDNRSYTYNNYYIPNELSKRHEFQPRDIAAAAECMYEFFNS